MQKSFRDGEFHPFGGDIMHPRRRLHWNERERESSIAGRAIGVVLAGCYHGFEDRLGEEDDVPMHSLQIIEAIE
jgi:hypothetical protein